MDPQQTVTLWAESEKGFGRGRMRLEALRVLPFPLLRRLLRSQPRTWRPRLFLRIMRVVKRLGEDFQTKLTGVLEPRQVGGLEFLGREIKRSMAGGHLTLGMPPAYIESIEKLLGQPLKPVDGIPRLAKFVSSEDEDLSAANATLFRSALGKLAWLSLSLPVASYHVSFLSTFQARPTKMGMRALLDVVRFFKSLKHYRQVFGDEGPAWYAPDESCVQCICDASWSNKSQAGGVILYAGSLLKSFSRRIASVCPSSAEAELFSIIETVHEALAIAIVIETMLNGLPERGFLGELVKTAGSMLVYLKTDSEAAKNIGTMAGLLRKVKHLELITKTFEGYARPGF